MSVLKNLVSTLLVVCSCYAACSANAMDAAVTPLLTKRLPELPGSEVSMMSVETPPAGFDATYRFDTHGFVYVLAGSIILQAKNGKEVTLSAGQSFYGRHVIARNANDCEPATFLVVLVKEKAA